MLVRRASKVSEKGEAARRAKNQQVRALILATLLLLATGCGSRQQVRVDVQNRSSQTLRNVTVSHQQAKRTIDAVPAGQSVKVSLPLKSEAGLELLVRFEDGRQLRTSGYVEPGYNMKLDVKDTELTLSSDDSY